MGARDLMTVRTEVVRTAMVGRLVDLIRAEPAPAPESLARVPVGDHHLAVAGYNLRRVEWRLFEPARRTLPELAQRLDERRDGRDSDQDAIAFVAGELASEEPLERPDPEDDRAVTWRVPGPGGHVRHYVALELIGARPAELKRAVVYGFLVRCCEEALEARGAD